MSVNSTDEALRPPSPVRAVEKEQTRGALNATMMGTLVMRGVGVGVIVQTLCFTTPWHMATDWILGKSGWTSFGSGAAASLHLGDVYYVTAISYFPMAAGLVGGQALIVPSRFWGRLIARGLEREEP